MKTTNPLMPLHATATVTDAEKTCRADWPEVKGKLAASAEAKK